MKNFAIVSVLIVCFLVVSATANSIADAEASFAPVANLRAQQRLAPISTFANRAVANLRAQQRLAPIGKCSFCKNALIFNYLSN